MYGVKKLNRQRMYLSVGTSELEHKLTGIES